jgi:PAS domain S-box-containing protein
LRNADGDIIGVLGTFEDITERKEAEEAMKCSEIFLDAIIEYSPISMWISDDKGTFIRQNQACRNLFRTQNDNIIGKYNVFQDNILIEQGFTSLIKRVFDNSETVKFSLWYDTSQLKNYIIGEPVSLFLDVTISPVLDTSGKVVNAIGQQVDLTEYKKIEEALRKANRMLAALSRVNEILVRTTEESELLQDVCQAVVETGGYNMAWVGFAEYDREKTVRPVAHAGYEDGYLSQIKITWADNELGHSPTGNAIRTGKIDVACDILTEPSFKPWLEEAIKRGYRLSAALPLTIDRNIIGAISLYRSEPGCLEPAEERLLSQLASDLSYGIASLRAREERRASELARRTLEQRLDEHKRRFYRETILSVTNGKLYICDISDVQQYISNAQMKTEVMRASEIGQARNEVAVFCNSQGLHGEPLNTFLIGVGEAITNALKHGGYGRVYAGKTDDEIWVGVEDRGPGIESLILPHAVLQRGFSTKPSLGLGYSIMLDVADRILLKTGPYGTTVILIKSLTEKVVIALDTIPDTWEGIMDSIS